MSGEMQFYLVAITVVVLYGLSKGGFSGLGSLGVPILSLVTSPVRAAAIVLPILIVQDWVSVWAFRRDYSLRNLVILTPSAVIGVGIGWLLAARVSDDAVRLVIGAISIVFVAYMLIRDRLGLASVNKPGVPSGIYGVRSLASPASSAMPGPRRSRSMSCLNIFSRGYSPAPRQSSSPLSTC
jgi:hypothetical protein